MRPLQATVIHVGATERTQETHSFVGMYEFGASTKQMTFRNTQCLNDKENFDDRCDTAASLVFMSTRHDLPRNRIARQGHIHEHWIGLNNANRYKPNTRQFLGIIGPQLPY